MNDCALWMPRDAGAAGTGRFRQGAPVRMIPRMPAHAPRWSGVQGRPRQPRGQEGLETLSLRLGWHRGAYLVVSRLPEPRADFSLPMHFVHRP